MQSHYGQTNHEHLGYNFPFIHSLPVGGVCPMQQACSKDTQATVLEVLFLQ